MAIPSKEKIRKSIIDFDRLMDLLGFENYLETHFYGINNLHP
ncbi:MAG: hypothetical protein U9R43_15560 [Thermodesulfobacteriota bacterium]|nr:hypothetical protein [Thermodesulfobacteriota bacterium]